MPRAEKWYKHLGLLAETACSWEAARSAVVARCSGMAGALAKLGILTATEYVDAVDTATTTVVAYYGAAIPLGRRACDTIDVAKRRGLARLGHAGPRTARWLVHMPRPEGLGMAMTWPHAAAALVVEIDRAYRAGAEVPARAAVAARTAKEYWRLGWRPTARAPVPLAWNPWHALGVLREEGIVEAALMYRLMARIETQAAAGDGAEDALATGYEEAEAGDEGVTPVWEVEGRPFGWRLARLGGVSRRHFYGGEEMATGPSAGETRMRGRWRTPRELGEYMGRGGCVLNGVRHGGRLTDAENSEYLRLLDGMRPEEHRWVAAQRGPPDERPAEVRVTRVVAAADGRRGQHEYLMEWSDGSAGWGPRPRSVKAGLAVRFSQAREAYEKSARNGEQGGLREQLGRTRGGEWLWLATQAPMAVGRREGAAIVAAAVKEGVETARAIMERAGGGTEAEDAIAEEAEREATEAEENAEGAWRAARRAGEGREGGERAAVQAARGSDGMHAGGEAESDSARGAEGGRERPAREAGEGGAAGQGEGGDAEDDAGYRSPTDGEDEDGMGEDDGKHTVRGVMEMAAAAELARARATALRKEAERRAAVATAGQAAAQRAAEAAEAEWVTARARRSTGELAERMVGWARAQPEHEAACRGNAEGAGAQEESGATPQQFRPSGLVVCFMGELGEAGEDGKRRMRPSLAISGEAAAAAAQLPEAMRPPAIETAYADVRVAWADEDRMWTGEALPPTEAELERATRNCARARERKGEREAAAAEARATAVTVAAGRRGQRSAEITDTGDEGGEGGDEGRGAEEGQQRRMGRGAQQIADMQWCEACMDEAAEAEVVAAEEEMARAAARAAEEEEEEGWAMMAEWEGLEGARAEARAAVAEAAGDTQDVAVAGAAEAAAQAAAEAKRAAATEAGNRAVAMERKEAGERARAEEATRAGEEERERLQREWQEARQAVQEARDAAERRYQEDTEGRMRAEFGTEVRGLEQAATAAEHALRREEAGNAVEARRSEREAAEATIRTTAARAVAARTKRAAGRGADVTAQEDMAEREVEGRESTAAAAAMEAARAATDAARGATRAAKGAEDRAARTRMRVQRTREAVKAAIRKLGGETRKEREDRGAEEEEQLYREVEYWEDMGVEQRRAVAVSPAMRVCVRHRWMEQGRPAGETSEGVAIGMETTERKLINTAATKHVMAMAMAIEKCYGLDVVYAVDGSADEAAARGEGEVGRKAASWGAWDGRQAHGGALPPGTGNQMAELVAMERVLAKHEAGDRVLVMGDCQSALQMVETAWRCGELGMHAAMEGRLGGAVIELITRHRLRIAGATEGGGAGKGGFVCFMWVKAHGGGIAPNAYADCCAKSHLAEEPRDVGFSELPRACTYAISAEHETSQDGGWPKERRWGVAADRPLRQMVIERLTRRVLEEWREGSTGGAVNRAVASGQVDRRLLAAVMCMDERPAGAREGAEARGDVRWPTATGMAIRMRADDVDVGRPTQGTRGGGRVCELCGEGDVEGDHVLWCPRMGRKATAAREAVGSALRDAAAVVPLVESELTPANATTEAWAAAARAAGGEGAIEGMGAHTPEEEGAAEGATGARGWAAGGWRQQGEWRELSKEPGSEDLALVAWCAVAIRRASEEADEKAGRAAAEGGGTGAEGRAEVEGWSLRKAGDAIGEVGVDEESGEPSVERRAVAPASAMQSSGVIRVRMRYAQLKRAARTEGGYVDLADWGGRDGDWLRTARTAAGREAEWTIHTRRGFCSGTGAAHRKEVTTAAVAPDGAVYGVAQPTSWPWQVEYEVQVRTEPEQGGGRQGGAERRIVKASIRLQRGDEGRMAARVCTETVRADGTRQRGEPRRSAITRLEQGESDRGLLALFWVFGWKRDGREGGRGEGQRGGMRRALHEAAEAAGRKGGWRELRRGLGGELRRLTMEERAEGRRRGAELQKEADEAADEAGEAAEAATEAARQTAGCGTATEAEEEGRIALIAAAAALGVDADAEPLVVRTAYLRKAIRTHPDKGGEAEAFRRVRDAYDLMRADAPTMRRQRATGGAERERATEQEAESTAREAGARARRTKEAAAGWRPTWEGVAAALVKGGKAYFEAWGTYQKEVRKARERGAKTAGYASAGMQRATEAARRRGERAAATATATVEAIRAMRDAEKRVMRRVTAARGAEATTLREVSGRLMLAALEADWTTVARENVVRVPWEMWCHARCVCRKRRCEHKGSARYETYEIAMVEGMIDADAEEGQEMEVTLERMAAPLPRLWAAEGTSGTWDVFKVGWKDITGVARYGATGVGIEIEPRRELEVEADSEGSESERPYEEAEKRRAKRAARGRLEEAAAMGDEAAREERARVEMGAKGADGSEAVAEEAWRGGEDQATVEEDAEEAEAAERAAAGEVEEYGGEGGEGGEGEEGQGGEEGQAGEEV